MEGNWSCASRVYILVLLLSEGERRREEKMLSPMPL
jgi:hypothetical protein